VKRRPPKNTIRTVGKHLASFADDGREVSLPPSPKAVHGPPVALATYTIAEFCWAHRISLAFYYVLRERGEGPVEMRIGARVLISMEAAAAWRHARETIATGKNAEGDASAA
jgi:hypothetical protein